MEKIKKQISLTPVEEKAIKIKLFSYEIEDNPTAKEALKNEIKDTINSIKINQLFSQMSFNKNQNKDIINQPSISLTTPSSIPNPYNLHCNSLNQNTLQQPNLHHLNLNSTSYVPKNTVNNN